MKEVHRLISPELDSEIKNMIKKIQSIFGIEVSIIDATKIIAYKSRNHSMNITPGKLREVLNNSR